MLQIHNKNIKINKELDILNEKMFQHYDTFLS